MGSHAATVPRVTIFEAQGAGGKKTIVVTETVVILGIPTSDEALIYAGSMFLPCEDCGAQVAIGPRLQASMDLLRTRGGQYVVVCPTDAAARGPLPYLHLGNAHPQEPS